jgi:hypothetical protein
LSITKSGQEPEVRQIRTFYKDNDSLVEWH